MLPEQPPESVRAPGRIRLSESAWFENMACEEVVRRLAGWFDGQGAPPVAGAMLREAADRIRLRRDLTSHEDQHRLGRPR